ncbi:MAG: hypothetical protein ACFFHD_06430, partial [Promethearchaeota archaeon]
LEMSAEVSPLLKPLLERDKLIEEATKVLKDTNFEKAAFLFDKISNLCLELGDDSLGKEFFEKAQKIKTMLDQVEAPHPAPASPLEIEKDQISISSEKTNIIKEAEASKEPISLEESKITELPPAPHFPPSISIPQKKVFSIEKQGISQERIKERNENIKQLPKQEDLKKPEIDQESLGIKLKPEDFLVKIRPKRVVTVPKEAKSQLKTSPFSQTKNDTAAKATEPLSTIPTPNMGSGAIKNLTEEESKGIVSSKVDITTENNKVINEYQKEDLKKKILDIKIKKSNLNKMALDYDMQELQGEISVEKLEEKKKKIALLIENLEKQIQDLQNLLND